MHQCWKRDGHKGNHRYFFKSWTSEHEDAEEYRGSISVSNDTVYLYEPVDPWHRNPQCFSCGDRATHTEYNRGYFCDAHMLQEWAEEALERSGYYSSSSRARHPWKFVLTCWKDQFIDWILR